MPMDHSPATGAVQAQCPPQRVPLVVVEGGDRPWKRLTEQANAAYARGDVPLARAAYEDALTEAERLFETALLQPIRVPAPVIYNVSCHNLAELCDRTGDKAAAEAFYLRAYDRLLAAAQSPKTPIGMRVSCVQHLKHALAVLARHLRVQQANEDRIGELAGSAHKAAYSVFRVVRHAEQAEMSCDHCPVIPS